GLQRNDDGTVAIGVEEVAAAYRHARDRNEEIEGLDVGERMRGPDASGEYLETGRPLRQVADRAVGDQADCAHPAMNRRLHLTPESAVTGVGAVQVLDNDDRWLRPRVDKPVIRVAQLAHFGKRAGKRLRRADRR